MPRAAPLAFVALALAVTAPGCGDVGDGLVTGASLVVPDCRGPGVDSTFAPFSMSLDFASVYEIDGVMTIRLAPRANRIQSIDQLGVVLPGVTSLRAALKADGSVTVPLQTSVDGAAADVHAASLSFAFLGRCPEASASLGGVGTLVLEALGRAAGEPVRAAFDVDVVDRRTGAVVGAAVHGELDFTIETGSPYTAFSPKDF